MFDVCPQYCQCLADFLPAEILALDRVPMQHYFAALERGANYHVDPLWGFELGTKISSAQYGLLGYFVESSDNLQHALDALLTYDKTVADVGHCQFSLHEEVACIKWQPHENNKQAILRNMTAWVAMVRHITGQHLTPCHIEFNFVLTAKQKRRLELWYGCFVFDSRPDNTIYFDADLLALPILTRNELVNESLCLAIEDLQKAYETEHHWLNQLRPRLYSCDLYNMSLTSLAQELGTSERTLQRQLKRHSLSFSKLVEQERKRRFKQFCQVMNKQALSELLGYAEQASLNRAVKRWFDMSPSEYIKTQQND